MTDLFVPLCPMCGELEHGTSACVHKHLWIREGVGTGGNLNSVLWSDYARCACGAVAKMPLDAKSR